MAKQFTVRLKRSLISTTASQRETARCIGLRKTGSSVVVQDTPAMRGQIMKLQHLVEVTNGGTMAPKAAKAAPKKAAAPKAAAAQKGAKV